MIDAFGHSAGNAALFADFGFDSLFFARMNRNDRNEFKKDKKMTFLWEPNPENYGSSKRILTHVFPEHYSGPTDFNMENKDDKKDPMVPYKNNLDFNLDHRCVHL
jgi:alpha-mannosidase